MRMMANEERKLAKASLISLEIDPTSILSLSKGVIFDTIVHNIEYTLNNRRTDPLPWKLIGMSLICDPSRNKNYMHKLQKMQCVPSVICTQIYHSKLVKTEAGVLATPGQKIIIPTVPRKRLTGIIVCRSIDELLFMECSNTETVHYIQYKLLSYERIATRELVNGPKLSSVGDKIIKTVFDFELTQNYGFPRQLLPVAIISFGRQDGCNLCSSIRNFLKLDEHQIFDKSYLVTSINVELDHLREEQERREDAEVEQELALEKIQRRQPLAELAKKTTDTGNARPAASTPHAPKRVPPLKIKLSPPEKSAKPSVSIPSVEMKFQCFLKLDRIDLSLYAISNLPNPSEIKKKKSTHSPTFSSYNSIHNQTKAFTVTKPYEHHKLLKRLNSETKKQSSSSFSELSKSKRDNQTTTTASSTGALTISLPNNTTKRRSTSTSSMSPIYRPKSSVKKSKVEKSGTKKQVNRPVLPSEYQCSLKLTRIDLSIYNLDLPPVVLPANNLPLDIQSTMTLSPSSSSSSDQQTEPKNVPTKSENSPDATPSISMMEQDNADVDLPQFINTNTSQASRNIIEEFSTPDLNESESHTTKEIAPNESLLFPHNKPPSQVVKEAMNEIPLEVTSEISLSVMNEVEPTVTNEENAKLSPYSSPCIALSPDLPSLNDDPVLSSIENPQAPITDNLNTDPQDYIIIVPCSDDEDDLEDEQINGVKDNSTPTDTDSRVVETFSSPMKSNTSLTLRNPLLTRVLTGSDRVKSHRLSTSSSSSCSSICTSILHNQSFQTPLHLTTILLPSKVLNRKQRQSIQAINFSRYDIFIPLVAQESLIDPRLIYRLQSITTDLRWPSPCNQCSMSSYYPALFTSCTQTILFDRKDPSDFVDPRRESLKSTILNTIYQRIKILIPNIFIINSNQFQKLLFEQTIFNTNCSLHLEYLLHRIKTIDDKTFFHMMKNNDEFHLSPFLLQLIFN